MSNQPASGPQPMGVFTSSDVIVLERRLPGTIEQVWDYLTHPPLMARWLAGGRIELRPGGLIDLDFDLIDCPGRENAHGTMQGVITECERPRLIGYTWDESGAGGKVGHSSTVTFELRPEREGWTVLKLSHRHLSSKDMSPVAAGWHVHLDVLDARLIGAEPAHFADSWSRWEPQYRSLLPRTI